MSLCKEEVVKKIRTQCKVIIIKVHSIFYYLKRICSRYFISTLFLEAEKNIRSFLNTFIPTAQSQINKWFHSICALQNI